MERIAASTSFVELAWMSEKQRQNSKLLELRSFDAYKNAAVLMIAMLDHLKLDMEISDVGMEISESDDYKEMSRSDKDTNSILVMIWEGARFSYKDKWKFIDLFT